MFSHSVLSSSFSGATWYTVSSDGRSTVSHVKLSACVTRVPVSAISVLRTVFRRQWPLPAKLPDSAVRTLRSRKSSSNS